MANTTNIDLVKPLGTDHALISVLNANSDKIDAEAGNVRSNFALVQNTNTATQAISKDQLVLWKGVLKKATAAIASGATLSSSNLADTKVSTELASLYDHIANIVKIVNVTWDNVTIAAGEYKEFVKAISSITPSGYTYVGCTLQSTGSRYAFLVDAVYETTYFRTHIKNTHTSSVDGAPVFRLIFVKTGSATEQL